MPYRTMQGSLSQPAPNATISELRATGAKQQEFQAIIPAYIRIEMDPLALAAGVVVAGSWGFEVSLGGESSGIALKWQTVKFDTGVALMDSNLEWYIPEFFPPLFDENFEIKMRSGGFAFALSCSYIMYYDIRKYTELEMVQALESYPIGL